MLYKACTFFSGGFQGSQDLLDSPLVQGEFFLHIPFGQEVYEEVHEICTNFLGTAFKGEHETRTTIRGLWMLTLVFRGSLVKIRRLSPLPYVGTEPGISSPQPRRRKPGRVEISGKR